MIPRIFIGTDPRSVISAWVLASSITRHASGPVLISQLIGELTPIRRKGLTSFTYARYYTPALVQYSGQALFLDSDIIVRGDVYELFKPFTEAVKVVKKKERFEWAAVMMFNAEKCKRLTKEYIENEKNSPQDFTWGEVGELEEQWMFLVDYQEKTPITPKLIHYTSGTPAFLECRNCDYADLWQEEKEHMLSTVSWPELMGSSVHAKKVESRLQSLGQTYLPVKKKLNSAAKSTIRDAMRSAYSNPLALG